MDRPYVAHPTADGAGWLVTNVKTGRTWASQDRRHAIDLANELNDLWSL